MNIFKKIRASVFDPAFYAKERTGSGGAAFGYFNKMLLLVVLVQTIVIGSVVASAIVGVTSQSGIERALQYVPEELRLTIKGGHASTNVAEPYRLAFPAEWAISSSSAVRRQNSPENILVIDTQATSSVEAFAQYHTAVLITRDYIVAEKSSGGSELNVTSLSSVPDVTIDRAQLRTWADTVRPHLAWAIPALIVISYVAMYVITLINALVIIAICSLIVWAVEMLKKSKTTYGQAFKLGLYAITTPILINLIVLPFGIIFPSYILALIFLLSIFINLRTTRAS